MPARTTRGTMTLMRQICELIPSHMVPGLAREVRATPPRGSPRYWGPVRSDILRGLLGCRSTTILLSWC